MHKGANAGVVAHRGDLVWGQGASPFRRRLQKRNPKGFRRETRCGSCFRGEAFTCRKGKAGPQPQFLGPSALPRTLDGCGRGMLVSLQLPSQSGEGPPPHSQTYQLWMSLAQSLLRTSAPQRPQSEGPPNCWTPWLGQRGSPRRRQRVWRCASAPRGYSGRASPQSQSWRSASGHQAAWRKAA